MADNQPVEKTTFAVMARTHGVWKTLIEVDMTPEQWAQQLDGLGNPGPSLDASDVVGLDVAWSVFDAAGVPRDYVPAPLGYVSGTPWWSLRALRACAAHLALPHDPSTAQALAEVWNG